jgi:hypothetical protein
VAYVDSNLGVPGYGMPDTSRGCEGWHTNQPPEFIGWALSENGGTTFADKGSVPLLTNVVNGITNLLGNAGDPVFARDNSSGTIYLVGNPQRPSVYYPTGTNTEPKLWVPMWRSVDGGQSFLPPINAAPGLIPGDTNNDIGDKPWIAVDNFTGTGQHNVYLGFVWFRYYEQTLSKKIRICRCLDGNGLIWETTTNEFGSLNSYPHGPSLAVDPNHAVYLVWRETEGLTSRIMFARSSNYATSFSPPVTLLTNSGVEDLRLTRTRASDTNDYFRTPILPLLVANPVNGHLYMTYNDRRSDGSDRSDIYFTQSTNSGTNWMLPPIRVNQVVVPTINGSLRWPLSRMVQNYSLLGMIAAMTLPVIP